MKKFIIITAILIAAALMIRGSIVYEGAFRSLSEIWKKAIGALTTGET